MYQKWHLNFKRGALRRTTAAEVGCSNEVILISSKGLRCFRTEIVKWLTPKNVTCVKPEDLTQSVKTQAGESNSGWLCGDDAACIPLDWDPLLWGKDRVFQLDNAADHNSRLKKDFFQENNVALLDHNTALGMDVYRNIRQFQTTDALCEGIFTTWSNIPTSFLEALMSSMPERIFEVINNSGTSL